MDPRYVTDERHGWVRPNPRWRPLPNNANRVRIEAIEDGEDFPSDVEENTNEVHLWMRVDVSSDTDETVEMD